MPSPASVVVLAFVVVGLGGLVSSSALADDVASGVAVMPFDGAVLDGDTPAARLAQRMAELSNLRVVPPSQVGVGAHAVSNAAQVRDWASKLAVDAVLLGRVLDSGEGQVIEVDVFSGHSGGPIAQHRILLRGSDELDELASAILEDLGVSPVKRLPAVGAALPVAAAGAGADSQLDEPGGGASVSGGIFDRSSKDPLSIDSEELEMIEGETSRRLIFRRNVRVRQGEMELFTEKLEAFYEDGSSQPTQLIATGGVRVLQAGRQARCDRAVYERDNQIVICTGHAELLDKCDIVRGPHIRFDLERDRIVVLGGASVRIRPETPGGQGCLKGGA